MDKNTVWAIVLSFLVVVVSAVVEIKVIIPRQQAKAAEKALVQQKEEEARQQQLASRQLVATEENKTESEETILPVSEENFTITTNKVQVTFTNRGGDIVSYKLLEHLDKDTNSGVQMVDNVTPLNRAFSISLGDATADVLNDVFNVKKIDDYTIGFYKNYEYTDGSGNVQKFVLGKLYTFKPDEYMFRLDVTVNGQEGTTGLNVDGVSYTLRTSPQIGPHYNPKDRYEVRQYVAYSGSKKTKKAISDRYYNKKYEWAGVAGKYFTILVKPENAANMKESVRCVTESSNDYSNAQIMLTRNAIETAQSTDSYYIYIGPRNETELIKYNSKETNSWDLVNAKLNQALQTSGILSPIEKVLKWAMEMIYKLVHNWGLAIIVLTVILKIILFPLNRKSALGTLKMQELQPQMQALQEKYKDNPQKMQEESAKLYKAVGYNPASGCLPIVLQMIILFAMYNVFNNYFEFRGASFIKGWIDDLSVGDSIWTWEKQIPLISGFTQNTLRILPFVYTISQLFNGMITQYGGAGGGQSKTQMALLMYGMPIMFFFILYNVASGLILYWTVSNILQMGQQIVINKITKKQKLELAKNQKPVNKFDEKFKSGKKKTR
ncbi:MAG TPA: membrane protein insertase YidC [Treponema sp.]|nr:membrane protein insertase YidC [Treponema sp.]